ncbi:MULTISPECIES: toprim domain-containing protein [unclassified Exiguobacterium]|uniref:toprim domain-containing protein n=1 Tax=unclassified Exiguobacterium TaxID=2644629 RepID=UPI001BEC1524|nr:MULTISPECIES: toprim domain-containing protein [unclassified Exiguobacterium]
MKLRGIELDIDYLDELETFDVWGKHRVREDKFQACSPFRYEKHPSFAVNLENGLWIDSGAESEELRKGNFVSLLSFLREEPASDTIDYLLEKYSPLNVDVDTLTLDLNLTMGEEEKKIFRKEELEYLFSTSEYLTGRGVSEDVQRVFQTGYDSKDKAVAFCWHDKLGNIVNVKYRSVKDKMFWYGEGQQIKHHVYGLHIVKRAGHEKAYIVESEIDALYLWSHGFPAIALGRAGMSEKQRDLILGSGIKTLIIATDNDKAGWRCGLQIIKEIHGLLECRTIDMPRNKKDMNDLEPNELRNVCKNHRAIKFKILT